MNNSNTNENEETTTHPNKIAGIGSQIRFREEGSKGKGKLGIIKSLKASGITVAVTVKGKNGNDKEEDVVIQPSQVTQFYKTNDGQE